MAASTEPTIASPVAKGITAVVTGGAAAVADAASGFSISSWGEAAAFAAFCYSILLIAEWWWKKFWRPFAERRGWIKPKKRPRVLLLDSDYQPPV